MNKLITWLLYIYLLIFPFGQFLRVPPQSTQLSEVHFYLTDVIVFLIGVIWVISKACFSRKLIFTPLTKPILIFFCICVFSLLVNYSSLTVKQFGVSFLYLLRWIVYAGLFFAVGDIGWKGERVKEPYAEAQGKREGRSRGLLIVAGIVAAVFGLIQYLLLPDTRFLEQYGWDPHYFRAIGTFLDPGFLGIILVLTLILLTERIWQGKNKLLILFWIVVYLVMALTYSRASYLGFLGGLGMLGFIRKSPKFIIGIIGLLAVTVILLPRPGGEGVRLERDSTIKFRIINWGHALTIIKDNPIFGVGFNSYRYTQQKYGFVEEKIDTGESHSAAGVDSSLLFVWATTGILGLLGYLWILREGWKRGDLVIKASLLALLIHSCFTNTLFYPWVMGWWWILQSSMHPASTKS